MTTYDEAVHSFDHTSLAALPAYTRLRQALSDLANESAGQGGMELAGFLAAAQDMAATAPYADMCDHCTELAWPHAVKRDDGWITGTYRCGRGHTWTCGYAVNIVLGTS